MKVASEEQYKKENAILMAALEIAGGYARGSHVGCPPGIAFCDKEGYMQSPEHTDEDCPFCWQGYFISDAKERLSK